MISVGRCILVVLAGGLMLSACYGPESAPPPAQGKSVTALGISGSTQALTALGQSLQLNAHLLYTDGSFDDVTSTAAWSSSNPAVATVSASGLVTAVADGSTGISAVYQGRSATQAVTVDLSNDSDWVFLGGISATGVVDTGVYDIVVDPRDSDLLYVSADHGLFVSRNQGATWTQGYVPPAGLNPGVLALDLNNPDRVFYGNRSSLLVSNDKGNTWRDIEDFPEFIRSVTVSWFDSHTIFVGLQGPSNSGIFRSVDDGATWESHSFEYPIPPPNQFIPWSIAEDPVDGTLYVGTELNEHPDPYHPPAFRSTDRGVSWQDITGSLPWHGIKIAVQPATHEVLFLTEGAGLYSSTDRGLTWNRLGQTIFDNELVIDANKQSRVFAGEGTTGGRLGGIYQSNDDGNSFISVGLEGRDCGSLSLSGDSALIYASCYNSGIFVKRLP